MNRTWPWSTFLAWFGTEAPKEKRLRATAFNNATPLLPLNWLGTIDRFIAPIFLVKGCLICCNVLPSMAPSKDSVLPFSSAHCFLTSRRFLLSVSRNLWFTPSKRWMETRETRCRRKKQSSSLLLETRRSLAVDKEDGDDAG